MLTIYVLYSHQADTLRAQSGYFFRLIHPLVYLLITLRVIS